MSLAQTGCLVVLDTGPAREIAEEAVLPSWVEPFLKMKEDGYRFSLADNACAELMHQRARGSIEGQRSQTMIGWLDKLLDANMPMMPGARDVLIAIGAEPPMENERSAAELSRCAWEALRRTEPQADTGADIALEQARDDWKEQFQTFEAIFVSRGMPTDLSESDDPLLDLALDSMRKQSKLTPPLSTRLDLHTRYFWRQFVRSKRAKEPYNVHAPEKRNDGIDFTLFTYLALPAFVVTSERQLIGSIKGIPSFQTDWILRPEDLVIAWDRGVHRRPSWPC